MIGLKYYKYPNMNVLDFVLTHYGSIDSLFQFLKDAGYSSSDEFYNDYRSIKLPQISSNAIINYFISNNIIVGTDDQSSYFSNLVYNDDLTFKSVILGDYNADFSNDFDIEDGLTVIVVGYEGMNLNVEFSISNTGNQRASADGTVTLDNGISPITKNFEGIIAGDDRTVFNIQFDNLSYGVYTVTIDSTNPLISDSETIGVLGKPVFQNNNNLAIQGGDPVVVGEYLTLEWSITNIGNRAGYYQGFSFYPNTYVDYNVSVDVNETLTLSRTVLIELPISTFVSSSGQSIELVEIPN